MLPERIANKLAIGDCWEWTASTNAKGYGTATGGLAHRAVWQALVGPIPEGLEFDHVCRNRKCCNPDHLELVTHEENAQRGLAGKTRQRYIGRTRICRRGHVGCYSQQANGQHYCMECNRERQRANP